MAKQKITPFLWFNDNAEEAIIFTPPFLKIQRLVALPGMEKQDPGQRDR